LINTTDPVLLWEASTKDSGGSPGPIGEIEANWDGKFLVPEEEGDSGFAMNVVHKAAPARPARKGIPMD